MGPRVAFPLVQPLIPVTNEGCGSSGHQGREEDIERFKFVDEDYVIANVFDSTGNPTTRCTISSGSSLSIPLDQPSYFFFVLLLGSVHIIPHEL